ncbi:hypothetical protein [Aminivibrio sp.]|uniref:hypothetical protein n=1 Tax=Aminivibrio sp. TaxID=1872489 RepID=UPI001A4449CA|nr:hypothetical protein [Aminivibrio sp.]MBL3539011.1 hypothetical protein [Aminivibrio sp.]MDK2959389.1 hypothetical protein [Synergistaceae bacterium]
MDVENDAFVSLNPQVSSTREEIGPGWGKKTVRFPVRASFFFREGTNLRIQEEKKYRRLSRHDVKRESREGLLP